MSKARYPKPRFGALSAGQRAFQVFELASDFFIYSEKYPKRGPAKPLSCLGLVDFPSLVSLLLSLLSPQGEWGES